jgi:hypothetical protein
MKKLMLLPLLLVACFCFAQDAKEIIGKPVKIGNLLVAEYDFPEVMNWDDAKKSCRALGNGWRLPTKTELNILYKNREKIGGFRDDIYWSSTEYDNSNLWFQRF